MKLLCCVKIVGNFESCGDCEWEIEDNNVDLTFYPKQINCFDASCVELALRRKKDNPEDISLNILTVSDGSDQRFLKPMLALGVDRCVIIKDESDLRFAPASVAHQIAEFVKREPQDWILFGSYQSVGQNGVTGILTASLLNIPCYTGVTEFSVIGMDLQITYKADDAFLTRTVSGGGVLILDESVTTLLRTPTIMQVMASKSRSIEVEEASKNECDYIDPVLCSLQYEHTENVCEMLTPAQLAQRVLKLCEEGE